MATVYNVGDTIDNRYHVRQVIGSGGMGVLYQVRDLAVGQVCGLKTLRTAALNSAMLRLLGQEFRTLTQLRHPHILAVYEFGLTLEPDREFYFTMEWVAGHELQAGDDIGAAIGQVLQALSFMHSRGIMHGDLKPANVLVDEGQQVRVVDFGIAQQFRRPASQPHSETYYSPGYAAPEMVAGAPATPQMDLWAVGAICYTLFCHEPPLFMPGMSDVLVPITLSTSACPSAIQEIIARLLREQSAERFQSADEVLAALATAQGQETVLETPDTSRAYVLRAPFQERTAETVWLRNCWNAVQEHGQGQVVFVAGAEGMGKTRLLEELGYEITMTAGWFGAGRCDGRPYQPWRDILRVLARYVARAQPQVFREAGAVVAETLFPEWWDDEILLAGQEPPAPIGPVEARLRLHHAVLRLVAAAGGCRPTLLVIDDYDLADQGTKELVAQAARTGTPVLLCCLTTETAMAHLLPRTRRLTVGPLAEPGRLVQEMMGWEEVPAKLRQAVAGGNPLFVQQLVRLLQGGVLQRTVGGWQVDVGDLATALLPESLEDLLRQRLRRLSAPTRTVLGWAAVMGPTFWQQPLDAYSNLPLSQVAAALAEMSAQGLVLVRSPAALSGVGDEYTFPSGLVQQEALQLFSTPNHHRTIAGWMEALPSGSRRQHAARLAYHWQEAGDYKQAAAVYAEAGRYAQEQYAPQEAIQYFGQALELERDSERRWALYMDRAELYRLVGDLAAQEADLLAASQLLPATDERQHIGQVRRARLLFTRGQVAEAEQVAGQVLAIVGEGQPFVRAEALKVSGIVQATRGQYEHGHQFFAAADALYRQTADGAAGAGNLVNIALSHIYAGQPEVAVAQLEEAVRWARECNAVQVVGTAQTNLALACGEQGLYGEGYSHYEEGLALAQAAGLLTLEEVCLSGLGTLERMWGRPAEAQAFYTRARQIQEGLGDAEGLALVQANEAICHLLYAADGEQQGRAQQDLQQACMALAGLQSDRLHLLTQAWCGMGEVRRGHWPQAEQYWRAVLDQDANNLVGDVAQAYLALALAQQGQIAEAQMRLRGVPLNTTGRYSDFWPTDVLWAVAQAWKLCGDTTTMGWGALEMGYNFVCRLAEQVRAARPAWAASVWHYPSHRAIHQEMVERRRSGS